MQRLVSFSIRTFLGAALALCTANAYLPSNSGVTRCNLDEDSARKLVLNIPDAVTAAKRGACLEAEMIHKGKEQIDFQLRNRCPKSGTGFIGNYFVHRNSGEVKMDPDGPVIESDRLQRLRSKLKCN